jgi:FAD/FMN-containing dehydrogenase
MLSDTMVEELRTVLGSTALATGRSELETYERGARYGAGIAGLVVKPSDTDQVRATVRWARSHGIHLIPQGANSNLVGAASPDGSGTQVIVSLERMRHEISVDVMNRSVTVGAGVTLHALNTQLAEVGLCLPIDLGANPTIGGMIAMNTGGARLLRYGGMRRSVLGMEVVLMDEEASVLDLMSALRKNNTGIDLKQLFIGSSGVLGIVTRAVLEVTRLPRQRATVMLVPKRHADVPRLVAELESRFADFLTSFEGMSQAALECVLRHRPRVRNPFAPAPVPPYCVLVELTSTANAETVDLAQALERALADILEMEDGPLETALFGDAMELWALRHSISDSLREAGRVIAFDISMPRSELPDFRATMLGEIAARWPSVRVCDFGHCGDGGDHFNIVCSDNSLSDESVAELRQSIYDRVVRQHNGSFSAEHGIGPFNEHFYKRYTSERVLKLSGALKGLLDPMDVLGVANLGS